MAQSLGASLGGVCARLRRRLSAWLGEVRTGNADEFLFKWGFGVTLIPMQRLWERREALGVVEK